MHFFRLPIYSFIAWFVLPIIAITILYCCIIYKVVKSNRKKLSTLTDLTTTTSTTATNHELETNTSDSCEIEQPKK
jgi:hypothetical protein